jgi:Zn-dependent peptidase ImmA (M78 family)
MIPTDENISSLANIYCVSREVILRKYLDSNRISSDEYNLRSSEYTADYFRSKDHQSERKNKGNYYNTQATYKGIQYLRLAFTKYYSKQISITQLSRYMNMKISSIQTLAKKKGWGTL